MITWSNWSDIWTFTTGENPNRSGSSQTSIEVSVETTYLKNVSGNSETTVTVNSEGQGLGPGTPGDQVNFELSVYEVPSGNSVNFSDSISKEGQSEASVNIETETTRLKGAIGSSQILVEVSTQGLGTRESIGSSQSELNVISAGLASKHSEGDSQTTINIVSSGLGIGEVSGASSTIVNVTSSGSGIHEGAGSSNSEVNVLTQGLGTQEVGGASQSIINVVTSGLGTQETGGASTSVVSVLTEGEATKETEGEGQAETDITTQGLGSLAAEGASQTSIHTLSTGQGIKQARVGSLSTINVITQGAFGLSLKQGFSNTFIDVRSLALGSPVPNQVVLLLPENEFDVSEFPVLLSWQPLQHVKRYRVQISTDELFTKNVLFFLTDELEILISLAHRETYYWRVRGEISNIFGLWSETRNFVTPNYLVNEYDKFFTVVLKDSSFEKTWSPEYYEITRQNSVPKQIHFLELEIEEGS